MDAAESFIRDFIAKEYAAVRAKYGEPNAVYIPLLQAVNALFARDVTSKSGISRSSSPNLDDLRPRQQSIVPRKILARREYAHPSLGTHFEFELSGREKGEEVDASARYYVRNTDGGMRIVSYDVACHDCGGTGKSAGHVCRHCGGIGWVYADGVKLACSERR